MDSQQVKKGFSLGALLILLLLIGLGLWAYSQLNSPLFEKNRPEINLEKSRYWNSSRAIEVTLSDDTGLKQVQAFLSDGTNSVKIVDETFNKPKQTYTLKVTYPKIGLSKTKDKLKLTVMATDISKWNYFAGNHTQKESILTLDNQRPDVFSLITSYGITKGGSALAIFKAEDKNLHELYIETNFGKKFYPTKFYKEGYYAALVAWPLKEKRFSAKVIAIDHAGNKTRSKLSFFLKNRKYRESHLQAKDSFINGKIAELAEDRPEKTENLSPTKKLDFVNRIYRDENDALIKKITSKIDSNMIQDFDIKPFYPLRNGKVVGSYGDHRYYYYKDKENIISEAYHLGLDLASIKMDEIRITNPGVCVYANYNGIYGNNLIVYHGLGLYTLYAHCSSILVQRGSLIEPSEVAARTGATGLALGDHLHVSMLVQGIFVRPAEWMDSKWIQTNITDVINGAKKMIDK
ncbi:MAG: M23 family metallopeptidase [Epsilonproteobacteria bacterium]|nr:M23 family metallopeptidase [Campylobacterota bacterium]